MKSPFKSSWTMMSVEEYNLLSKIINFNLFLSVSSKCQCTRVLLFFVILILLDMSGATRCAAGIDTPGHTYPNGDIVLEYGTPLKIQCILDEMSDKLPYHGKNSSDLTFFHNKKELGSDFVSIINETTIQLEIEQSPPGEYMYYCKLRRNHGNKNAFEAVCLNKVVIGYKPQEPKNFSCISYNWENLTCKWEPPQNYVTTKYSITFKLPGRFGSRTAYPCPTDINASSTDIKANINSCYWDTTTNPIYRQAQEDYTFSLIGVNALGHWNGTYKFNHYANVIPAPPLNLTVVDKTVNSVLLHWNVSFPMQTFPGGLHHRITYQSQWDNKDDWQVIDLKNTTRNHPSYFYNLTGLTYANAIYDVRVCSKSSLATTDDRWSQFSVVTFRTPPQLPGSPPLVDIGSFEVSETATNRDIFIYWQTIPKHLENGDNFSYQVLAFGETGQKSYLSPNETSRTFARYRVTDLYNNYYFQITSTNEVGSTSRFSQIFVPGRNKIPKEPIAFTKIAFENGLYELSWKPPPDNKYRITNYTIFWCNNKRDRPYQCTGFLDWIHVPHNSTIYNMTVPDPTEVYQFAISANTEYASSGMVWASCTVFHNKVVGKMKTVWINHIDSLSIEVGWKLDCSDRIGIMEGFRIYYCPIVSPYNRNCKGPKLNVTIPADISVIRGVVENLKPYTTYMLAVAVMTKNGEGQPSDPLYNTTLEAAPSSPPSELFATNITNTTISLRWQKPKDMNGVLRYYVVHYDGLFKKVEDDNQVELTGLAPYANYSISIAACTVACSNISEPIYVATEIGTPERISVPVVRFINSSQVKLTWKRPSRPAGPLNYYQISGIDGTIQNTTKEYTQLSIMDCTTSSRDKLYRFMVRAVNLDSEGKQFYGPWSEPGEGNCYSNGPTYRVWIVIWVIGTVSGVAFIFCLAYSSKRMWLKCKSMQDVDVKLPPGLAPNITLLPKSAEANMHQSPVNSSSSASTQESTSSSLTSNEHRLIDTRTDVDRLIVDNTIPAKEAASPWEFSNLRQRNVSGITKPYLEEDNADAMTWKHDSNGKCDSDLLPVIKSAPNLSDLGVCDHSQKTWSSKGYISMLSSQDLSSNSSSLPKEKVCLDNFIIKDNLPNSSDILQNHDLSESDRVNECKLKLSSNYVALMSFDHPTTDSANCNDCGIHNVHASPHEDSYESEFGNKKAPNFEKKPYIQIANSANCNDCGTHNVLTSPHEDSYESEFGQNKRTLDFEKKPYIQIANSANCNDCGTHNVHASPHEDSYESEFGNKRALDFEKKPYIQIAFHNDNSEQKCNANSVGTPDKPYIPISKVMRTDKENVDVSLSHNKMNSTPADNFVSLYPRW